MTKNNKKKSKQQKKAKPRVKNQASRTTTMPTSKQVSGVRVPRNKRLNHVAATCSITDPFCIHARGAQRPDGGPPSIPFQFRAVATLIAHTTSGACRYTFVPNPLYQYAGAVVTAGVWTNPAAWANMGGADFISTNAKELRITSYGVIIRSAMTATTAKGLVILSSDPAPAVSATYAQGSMANSESVVLTLAAGMEHSWVSKPMGQNAHLFQPISVYTSTMSNFDWTSLIVEVNGSDTGSNTPFLTAEVVINVEFTVAGGSNTTALSQLQKAPPPPNRAAIAAAEHSHATRPSFIAGGVDKASNFLERAATNALDSILEGGMALLFG